MTLSQLAVVVGLVSITFFFGALILAFGLRMNEQPWQRFTVPAILWVGTGLLLASSWYLERGRRALKHAEVRPYRKSLAVAISLAAGFLFCQVLSASDLISQGVTASGNPHGSAFYVFMGIHGAHLVGGIAWLIALLRRSRLLQSGTETDLRVHRRSLAAVALYWHFMGLLWLVLFFFLKRWTA